MAQWYPFQGNCLASAFHIPHRCASATSWSIAIARVCVWCCTHMNENEIIIFSNILYNKKINNQQYQVEKDLFDYGSKLF